MLISCFLKKIKKTLLLKNNGKLEGSEKKHISKISNALKKLKKNLLLKNPASFSSIELKSVVDRAKHSLSHLLQDIEITYLGRDKDYFHDIFDLLTNPPKDVLNAYQDRLTKVATFLQHKGYNKEYKIIKSVLAKKYITFDDVNLIKQVISKRYNIVSLFNDTIAGREIAKSVYHIDETNKTICSEASFSDALYHLCETVATSPNNHEDGFLILSDVHSMALKIKNEGNKLHLWFYNPSDTTILQEIELSSAEQAKKIKIQDIISPLQRLVYKTTDLSHLITRKPNDTVSIMFIKDSSL